MQNKTIAFLFLLFACLICPSGLLCYADSTPLVLPGTVTGAVYHPSDPVVYTIDSPNPKLYRINNETHETKEISLNTTPYIRRYFNNELYVECSKYGNGTVIDIYDAQTLALKDKIVIGHNLVDMVIGNDGFIYTSDYDSNGCTRSFSRTTKSQVSEYPQTMGGMLAVNPVSNSLYLFPATPASDGPHKINYSNGVITDVSDSNSDKFYPDIYQRFGFMAQISPDGKYAFSDSGTVFTCSQTEEDDRNFYFSLNYSHDALCFDAPNHKFYVGTDSPFTDVIRAYDCDTFQCLASYTTYGHMKYLFAKDNTIIGISIHDHQYYLEKLDTNTPTKTFPSDLTQTTLTKTDTHIELDMKDADCVTYHPTKPYVYTVDILGMALHRIDTENATDTKLSIYYRPTAITYYNDELYVGYGSQGYIDILDATTLTAKDRLMTNTIFGDVAIGNDGFIYTSGNRFARSFSREPGKPFVSQYKSYNGYLTMNPVSNSFYCTDYRAPSILRKSLYANGIVTDAYTSSSFYSPYPYATNRISPDGRYIFNGSGRILTCSDTQSDDMNAYSNLGGEFNDLCFDHANKNFYASVVQRNPDDKYDITSQIIQYDCNTLESIASYETYGVERSIYFKNDALVVLSWLDNRFYIETIDTKTPADIFAKTLVTTALTRTGNKLNLNIQQAYPSIVYHPTKPYIYMTDNSHHAVCLVDKEKALETKLATHYEPTALSYHGDELYIGYGDQGWIDIVDADTLAFKEKIVTKATFESMAVGNDGFIYIDSSRGFIGINRTTHEDSYANPNRDWNGNLTASPLSNTLYVTSWLKWPSSLYKLTYANGKITSSKNTAETYSGTLSDINKISPDEKYIFNGNGAIFISSDGQPDDMKYLGQLPVKYGVDFAFDLDHNSVMTAEGTNIIYTYDYTTHEKTGFLKADGEVVSLRLERNDIAAICRLDGKYFLASYDTASFQSNKSLGIQLRTGDKITLQLGGSMQLEPHLQYSDGTSIDLTDEASYLSSNPDVADVSPSGYLYVKSYGTATITIHWGDETKVVHVSVQPILSTVDIPNGTLSPSFDSATQEYTLVLPPNTTKPAAIMGVLPYYSNDKVDVFPAQSLKDKTVIRVTAADGTCFTDYSFGFEISQYIESAHPYASNCHDQWIYTAENPLDTVNLTFSSDTFVGIGFGYIYITDANDVDIAGSPFTGNKLAGKTVHISGGTAKIRLTSYGSVTGYGLKITDITTSVVGDGGGGSGGGGTIIINTNHDFQVNALPIVDNLGKPFSNLSSTINVNANIKNISATTKNVSLYMTLLDADGKTLDVRCVKKALAPEATEDIAGSIPVDNRVAAVRVFLWDSATQQPIVTNVDIHKETSN